MPVFPDITIDPAMQEMPSPEAIVEGRKHFDRWQELKATSPFAAAEYHLSHFSAIASFERARDFVKRGGK